MSTEDEHSELRSLVPRILQALHANNHWTSVKNADEIRCEKFEAAPCPWVGLLRPPVNIPEFPVAVKFESKISVGSRSFKLNRSTVDAHQMLSDVGVATTLLAYSLDEEGENPNFAVETIGEVCHNKAVEKTYNDRGEDYWDYCNGVGGFGGHMATLAAKLHKRVDVQWFEKFREEIRECCPLMKNEPNNSVMWLMMRADHLAEARAERLAKGAEWKHCGKTFNKTKALSATDEDLEKFVAVLPRPCGHYASRAVTCHADLWAANVVMDSASNQAKLIDLEGVTVSCAAAEMAQFGHQREVCKVYLQQAMALAGDGEPTEEDIDKFWLEVLIAGHIITDILRYVCWHGCHEADFDETSVSGCFAYAERFSAFADKLRNDSELAMRILRKREVTDGGWCNDEVMDEVLGKAS